METGYYTYIIAERLSARLMIAGLGSRDMAYVGPGIPVPGTGYIYMSVTLLRMRRHVRVPAVRSMGMNFCVCV